MGHFVSLFIATIDRAFDAIIQSRWHARDTVTFKITALGAIAEEAVIARGGVGSVGHLISDLVAAIDGAADAVVEGRSWPG